MIALFRSLVSRAWDFKSKGKGISFNRSGTLSLLWFIIPECIALSLMFSCPLHLTQYHVKRNYSLYASENSIEVRRKFVQIVNSNQVPVHNLRKQSLAFCIIALKSWQAGPSFTAFHYFLYLSPTLYENGHNSHVIWEIIFRAPAEGPAPVLSLGSRRSPCRQLPPSGRSTRLGVGCCLTSWRSRGSSLLPCRSMKTWRWGNRKIYTSCWGELLKIKYCV